MIFYYFSICAIVCKIGIVFSANDSKEECSAENAIRDYKQNIVMMLYDELECYQQQKQQNANKVIQEVCIILERSAQNFDSILAQNDRIRNENWEPTEEEKRKANEKMNEVIESIDEHFENTKSQIMAKLESGILKKIENFVIELVKDNKDSERNVKKLEDKLKENFQEIGKLNEKLYRPDKRPNEKREQKKVNKYEPRKNELSYQSIMIIEQLEEKNGKMCEECETNTENEIVEENGSKAANRRKRATKVRRACCSNCCVCCGLDVGGMCRSFFKFIGALFFLPGAAIWRSLKTIGYLGCQGIYFIWWAIVGPLAWCKKPARAELFYCCKTTPADAWAIFGSKNFAENYGMDLKGCTCWHKMEKDLANIWKISERPAMAEARPNNVLPPVWVAPQPPNFAPAAAPPNYAYPYQQKP